MVCITLSCIIVSAFQCIPVHSFWDTLAGLYPGGKCINVRLYFFITGVIITATDFALLALVSHEHDAKPNADLKRKVLTKVATAAADPNSLASENQPAAEARSHGDIHHRPLVSLRTLTLLAPLPDIFILTTRPAPAPLA